MIKMVIVLSGVFLFWSITGSVSTAIGIVFVLACLYGIGDRIENHWRKMEEKDRR